MTTASKFSFFSQTRPALTEANKPENSRDVGGDFFRAVAAGVIGHVLEKPWIRADLSNLILSCYFKEYPQHRKESQRYLTAVERMRQLADSMDANELIDSMALILQQMVVDAFESDSKFYREAYIGPHGQPPERMRLATTRLDEACSFTALTRVLNIPLEVRVMEGDKIAAKPLEYNTESEKPATNPRVVLERHDGYYMPRTTLNIGFKPTITNCTPLNTQQEGNSTANFEEMKQEEARLVNAYESICKRWADKVAAGELNKEQLVALHIATTPKKHNTTGSVVVHVEHSPQQYINRLVRAHRGGKYDVIPTKNPEQKVTYDLIRAFASAICIHQLPEEHELLAQIERSREECSQAMSL